MQLTPIHHRSRLDRIAPLTEGGALVALSQPTALRNSTVEHIWRQESFLYWLTGFEEPESALVVAPYRPEGQRYILFLRDKDPERELWDGRRLGVAGAKAKLAIDEAYPIGELWTRLPELMNGAKRVYYNFGVDETNDRRFLQALAAHKARFGKKGLAVKLPVYDASYPAGQVRLRKQPEEADRLRAAATATKKAYATVLPLIRPGMNERDVHGLLIGEFMKNGGEMEAYGSIVAGGANACVLHYRENNMPLKDGELLLIDAGTQYQYYASDVTRTLPVGKRFTPEQKDLYEIVLAAQKAAIHEARVGQTLKHIHDAAVDKLVDGLLTVKLLKGSKAEIVEKGTFRKYYPHGTSHWIGMDVHDVGQYQDGDAHVPLESGMYFSVEPGLYVDPADENAPPAFRGIGIRVEDDVMVTPSGPDVFTAGIAKEVHELENRY
jgi:Xaa-Pro aminopeptidase